MNPIKELQEKIMSSKFNTETYFKFQPIIIYDTDHEKSVDVEVMSGITKIYTLHYRWYSDKRSLFDKGWNLGGVTYLQDLHTFQELLK